MMLPPVTGCEKVNMLSIVRMECCLWLQKSYLSCVIIFRVKQLYHAFYNFIIIYLVIIDTLTTSYHFALV